VGSVILFISARVAFQPFWHQSKERMRLPICSS